eukprot:m.286356 g.286356  ORF g.286356 m.286356 type:complete len:273 (-) comp19927_c0_seq1:194-1012(-)
MKSGLQSFDRIKVRGEMCNYQKQSAGETSSHAPSTVSENSKQASAAGPAVSAPLVHIVAMTDTFASLGVKYGVSPISIQRLNGFKLGDNVYSRREILIPTSSRSGTGNSGNGVHTDSKTTTLKNSTPEETDKAEQHTASSSAKKDFKSFLSRFDTNIKDMKSKTDQLISKESSSLATPVTPRPEGLTRLNYGSMTSHTGKLEAQNQALDVIGCILMSDPKVRKFNGRGTPSTPESTGSSSSATTLVQHSVESSPAMHDGENDLDQDTEIFDL